MLRRNALFALFAVVGCPKSPADVPAAMGATSRPVAEAAKPADNTARAKALSKRLIIVDTHIDLPYRLEDSKDAQGNLTEDVSKRTDKGDFDHVRAVEGGLDAAFMSIYVPAKYQETGGAKVFADGLIDMVEGIASKHPDKFVMAKSVADVEAAHVARKVAFPMGMENGAPIEGKLANVKHFADRGIRYITLTHSKDNHISDSSYDDKHTHKGLSTFGKTVVAEMNRVGIMVDISHVSDQAFWHALELSKTPMIASHSSCRHFTPGFERNMSDEMIIALAAKGGVIQITFGSGFIDAEIQAAGTAYWAARSKFMKDNGLERKDPKVEAWVKAYKAEHPSKLASVETVANHIDHVAKIAGVNHVGLGSDFDGVGDTLPTGLKDVSYFPNLIRVLLDRGYRR